MTQKTRLIRPRLAGNPCWNFYRPGQARGKIAHGLLPVLAWTLLATFAAYGQATTSTQPAAAMQRTESPAPAPLGASISGTVTDTDNDVIPGATVTLQGPDVQQSAITSAEGGFAFNDLEPGGPYHLTVSCRDCISWKSEAITLQPGQFLLRNDIHIRLSGGTISVVVTPKTQLQIATEQVHEEEQQRVLGIVPNFFVSYSAHPVPLTAGLKYRLSLKTALDPVTIAGALFIAGIDQASGTPHYGGGVQGYAKRFGNSYATGFVDVMTGGALLPALLHQDPRYFYQGTGTRRSRLMHAIRSTFLCRGDNGKTEIDFSGMGGDLMAGVATNFMLPAEDRGTGAIFEQFGLSTAGHMATSILQEFFLNRLTKHGHAKR